MSKNARITPDNFKLYGVMGFPLKHTLSPLMHQAAIAKLGLRAFYAALELDSHSFLKLMRKKRQLLLDGFNLTIPHKQIVLPYLDSVSREARAIGAVNTVIRKGSRWVGENTDAYGFIRLLRETGWTAKGKSVLILGAGGASRACVYALCREGAKEAYVLNRTVAKAKALCRHFQKLFPKSEIAAGALNPDRIREILSNVNLVVNTTSVGLERTDKPVIADKDWPAGGPIRLAVDLIYNPSVTPFLRAAKQAGWKTRNGLGMLLYQGARSFELWTGKPAPLEEMRKALLHGCESRLSL